MKTSLVSILLLLAAPCFGDQKAITDTGDQVILMKDGTWKYVDSAQSSDVSIQMNSETFEKPEQSSFLIKSTKNDAAVWINPQLWSFEKVVGDEAKEYAFQLKGEDVYAWVITERIEIPLDYLVEVSLENAKGAAPDASISHREYRAVNGKKVIYQEMRGSIEGSDFTFIGYYYSDSAGSTQLVAFTGTNLVPQYRPSILEFLNGLVTR